ncbi:MAG: hypothetical protein HGA72_03840 [Chlorobiaceae bacterium]|nr:hypothetical protein [Chlorobiaceae bacterium]
MINGTLNSVQVLEEAIRHHSFRPKYIIVTERVFSELIDYGIARYYNELPEFDIWIMDESNPNGGIFVHTQVPVLANTAQEKFDEFGFLLPEQNL